MTQVSTCGIFPTILRHSLGTTLFSATFAMAFQQYEIDKTLHFAAEGPFFQCFTKQAVDRVRMVPAPKIAYTFPKKTINNTLEQTIVGTWRHTKTSFRNNPLFIGFYNSATMKNILLDANVQMDVATPENVTNLLGYQAYNILCSVVWYFSSSWTGEQPNGHDRNTENTFLLRYTEKDSEGMTTRLGGTSTSSGFLGANWTSLRAGEQVDKVREGRESIEPNAQRFKKTFSNPRTAYPTFQGEDITWGIRPKTNGDSFYTPREFADKNLHDGLLFPYFKGMNIPDSSVIIDTLQRYFYHGFGNNEETCFQNFDRLRKGIPAFCRTESGIAMSHIFFGIDMAIRAQAGISFLHTNTEYHGFALLGNNFRIHYLGKSVSSMEKGSLNEAVKELMTSEVLLERLLVKIEALDLTTGGKQKIDRAAITRNRHIFREYKRRVKPSTEESDEIRDLANRCAFHETFWPMDAEHISRILDTYTGHYNLPDDAPMCIQPDTLNDKTENIEIFSAFGHTCPVISSNMGKKDVQIYDTDVGTIEEEHLKLELQLPKGIPIFDVSYKAAAISWHSISNKARLRYAVTQKGNFAGCQSRINPEGATELYMRLRRINCAARMIREAKQASGSKRKEREETDVEMEEGEKTPKIRRSVTPAFSNNFL